MNMVYTYLRVSGKTQVDGDGPERQREAIAAFCRENRLQAMGEFFEKGVSGTVEGMDRPAFADMMERITHMETNGVFITAIVVERVDRLARDLMVSELLLAECRKREIAVYAADQGQLIDMAENGGDPTRILIRQILGALAQWEKSALVRKLKVARDRKKLQTGRCSGKMPYGFYPAEKEALNFILASRAEKKSYAVIAQSLNSAMITNRAGGVWTNRSVYSVVANAGRLKKKQKYA